MQSAISKGAFGIVSQSPLMFLAAKYPQQAGMPVTGTYDDGPEWGQQPYTNMFAADNGSVDPKYPVNTQLGDLFKKLGGTVLGAYGYSISPSSSRAAIGTADSFKHAGGKVGVLDTTVPFGGVDFTAEALVAKKDGVNAISPAMDANSNYALATALQQAGVKVKAAIYATGYQPDVIHSTDWKVLQGGYFLSLFRPWDLPNAATQQMQAAMEKYAHFTKTQFPNFGQYESWAGADLMIKGLQMAGANPTRAAVIKDLRGLKSYNAGGLLPVSFNYSTDFGHNPGQDLRLGDEGGPERVHADVVTAFVRDGPGGDVDRELAERQDEGELPACTHASGSRRRVSGASTRGVGGSPGRSPGPRRCCRTVCRAPHTSTPARGLRAV